jgi:geranylgeranylglycerol-phosphate geranylgeranyltransferase
MPTASTPRSGWVQFLTAYVKSMRLYYAFVTGIAGWVGVSFYQYRLPQNADPWRSAAILAVLFLAWGINQIFNDYLGLPEDRVNAPHRPMVTGELPAGPALALSVALLVVVLALSYGLNPLSTIPILLGVLLNLLYEYAKAWSLLGNVVFGLSISMCTAYGFLAAGPAPTPVFNKHRIAAVLMVALMNGLMTYYTYFKDYRGDLAAGKRTFVVRYGLTVARYAGVAGAFLPTAAMFLVHVTGWLSLDEIIYKEQFTFCAAMTVFLQLWTAILYFKYPSGEQAYFSLVTNTRACVAGQVTLIAIFNGTLSLYLLAASYIFIGFLFDLHRDAKA